MRTVIFFATLTLLTSFTECSSENAINTVASNTPSSTTNTSTSTGTCKRKRSSKGVNDFVFAFGTPEKSLLIEIIKDIITANKRGQLALLKLTNEVQEALGDHLRHPVVPGYTLMHLAAGNDNDEAIGWLNGFGCDTNVFMGKGCTPLQVAVSKGNLKAVRALLSIPATSPYTSSASGRTAFMAAVHIGNLEIVNEFLGLQRVDFRRLLNAVDSEGRSVLELAYIGNRVVLDDGSLVFPADPKQIYENAHDAVVARLLDFAAFLNADPEFLVRLFAFDRPRFNFLAKKLPATALRALKLVDADLVALAVMESDLGLLRELHEIHSPVALNASGSLPIHLAASLGLTDVVMFYLAECSVPIDAKNSSGQTIEELARINGRDELAKAIELFQIIKEFA